MDNSKERQGDFVFTAQEIGEYRFCFNNEMSTFADKMVDFEIAVCLSLLESYPFISFNSTHTQPPHTKANVKPPPPPSPIHIRFYVLPASLIPLAPKQVENEARTQLPSKQGTSPEQTSALEESIYKVSGHLSTINRNQKYFRTRENRNFSTVRSTEKRIFNFSFVESGLMVCMAGLQVFIVRFFFQGARKGMCLSFSFGEERKIGGMECAFANVKIGYV